jgi:hypothetical protein
MLKEVLDIEPPCTEPPFSKERAVYDVIKAACEYRDAMRGSYSPTIDGCKDNLVAAVDSLRKFTCRDAVDVFLNKERL